MTFGYTVCFFILGVILLLSLLVNQNQELKETSLALGGKFRSRLFLDSYFEISQCKVFPDKNDAYSGGLHIKSQIFPKGIGEVSVLPLNKSGTTRFEELFQIQTVGFKGDLESIITQSIKEKLVKLHQHVFYITYNSYESFARSKIQTSDKQFFIEFLNCFLSMRDNLIKQSNQHGHLTKG